MRSSVTKTFKISYGHLLTNHKGDCARDHGHNAKIDITISGEIFEPSTGESMSGMIVDFGDMKKIVQEAIGQFDHRFIAEGTEWNYLLAKKHAPERMDNFVVVNVPTTAENLSRLTLIRVQRELNVRFFEEQYVVESVKWWETDDNCAEYSQG